MTGRDVISADERGRLLWPLALYLLLSLVFFAGPVISNPSHTIIASDEIDSSAFQWFLAWWPHAVVNGLNPFITHVVFAPEGFNLQWSPSIPGPSLIMGPITLIFGPATSWNILSVLAPTVDAWAAYWLCLTVTGRLAASAAGGFLFGFSPYVLAHLGSAPYLALGFLVPLLAVLVLQRLNGVLSRRRYVVLMTIAVIAQFSISSEVLLGSVAFGLCAFLLGFLLYPARRTELVGLVVPTAIAGAIAGVVISPALYFFFTGRHYPPLGTFFSASPLAFVTPPHYVQLTTSHQRPGFFGAAGENYLGVPLLVVLVLIAWQRRAHRSTRLLLGCAAIAAIASLGRVLFTGRRYTSVPLPWHFVSGLPILRYAIPERFALFVILPCAVLVAVWLSEGRGRVRWLMVTLVVLSFLPNVGNQTWHTRIADPVFFSHGIYRRYLRPADRVLTVPARGPNERWQADTGFAFTLAAGYLASDPPSYQRFVIWNSLLTGVLPPNPAHALRAFIRAMGVTAVVVDATYPGPWRSLFATLGVRPVTTGGVIFYRLTPLAGATAHFETLSRTLLVNPDRAVVPAPRGDRWAPLLGQVARPR